VLESNRDLVLRRLVECLGRDRTKHQVAEVTSLGLVQMTRKRVGQGLVEVFSEPCEHCNGRGIIIHSEPVSKNGNGAGSGSTGSGSGAGTGSGRSRRGKGGSASSATPAATTPAVAQVPRGPIPAGLVASLARHAEHHDDAEHHEDAGHHEDAEHHEGAEHHERHEDQQTERHDVQTVASPQETGAQQLPSRGGSAPSGEAAVAEPLASTSGDAGQPAVAAEPPAEAPAEATKPRRRRRAASAPAGPPARHDADDEPGQHPDASAMS
jgi:ribonuclease E